MSRPSSSELAGLAVTVATAAAAATAAFFVYKKTKTRDVQTPFMRLQSASALRVKPNVNRQIVLKRKATGLPTLDNFELREAPLVEPKENEVQVRTLWLSVDPYMRGRIGTDKNKSSTAPLEVGQVIVGGSVGEVVISKHPRFKKGDRVMGAGGWQEYYTVSGDRLRLIPPEHGLPLEKYIGSLGMPGLTAYYGLMKVGQPKEKETLVVSAASGAVGSVVCQLGKIHGLEVIGIAGSPNKVRYLLDVLKLDGAINYKTENVGQALDRLCPEGVDIYFDNTGGEIYDQVMLHIRKQARVIICGQISDYNADKPSYGPRLNHLLLWRTAKVEGFLVNDYAAEDAKAVDLLAKWMKEGKLQSVEDIEYGLEAVPIAFSKLFEGANFGKQVIKIAN
jgi:NADPH-dependent curcumin reductase CurA